MFGQATKPGVRIDLFYSYKGLEVMPIVDQQRGRRLGDGRKRGVLCTGRTAMYQKGHNRSSPYPLVVGGVHVKQVGRAFRVRSIESTAYNFSSCMGYQFIHWRRNGSPIKSFGPCLDRSQKSFRVLFRRCACAFQNV